MNLLINDIFTELKDKYQLSRLDIERIVDSQFRLTVELMGDRKNLKDIKWMYLGEIRPSEYIKQRRLKDERLAKQIETDNTGLV